MGKNFSSAHFFFLRKKKFAVRKFSDNTDPKADSDESTDKCVEHSMEVVRHMHTTAHTAPRTETEEMRKDKKRNILVSGLK